MKSVFGIIGDSVSGESKIILCILICIYIIVLIVVAFIWLWSSSSFLPVRNDFYRHFPHYISVFFFIKFFFSVWFFYLWYVILLVLSAYFAHTHRFIKDMLALKTITIMAVFVGSMWSYR